MKDADTSAYKEAQKMSQEVRFRERVNGLKAIVDAVPGALKEVAKKGGKIVEVDFDLKLYKQLKTRWFFFRPQLQQDLLKEIHEKYGVPPGKARIKPKKEYGWESEYTVGGKLVIFL